MLEFLEIVIAVLAIFGGYAIIEMIRVRLLYPKRVRMMLRCAIAFQNSEDICEAAQYANYLRREQKISPKRLIILIKDGIIVDSAELSRIGEICTCSYANIINCKENDDDV